MSDTQYLFLVEGRLIWSPQPAVPTSSPTLYYLPRAKRYARLGTDVFVLQGEARRAALANPVEEVAP